MTDGPGGRGDREPLLQDFAARRAAPWRMGDERHLARLGRTADWTRAPGSRACSTRVRRDGPPRSGNGWPASWPRNEYRSCAISGADAETGRRLAEAEAGGPWRLAGTVTYGDVVAPDEMRNRLLAGLRLSVSR